MFSDPRKNVEQFDLAPGMKVADFGCGAGYYAFAMAHKVGSSGQVFALDVHKELLLTLKREAIKTRLHNIEVVWCDLERPKGTKLRDGAVERGVAADVLFQVDHKEAFVHEIARVMKVGGKILVIDWTDSFGGIGPKKDVVVSAEKCRELFESAGFGFEREIDAGMHHYGLIFRKI
jgi:ubiquinone/menaquinone biosynthesis C-methylase UbiE